MAFIDTKIINDIDNKYVNVEVSSKRTYPVNYKVPKEKADEFCASYKKFVNRIDAVSNTSFFVTILGIAGLINHFAKNLKGFLKFTLTAVGAIGTGIGVAKLMIPAQQKKHDKFLAKYEATQIN